MPENKVDPSIVKLDDTVALEGAPSYPLEDPDHPLHGWDDTVTPFLAVLSIPLVLWRIGVFFERARKTIKGAGS